MVKWSAMDNSKDNLNRIALIFKTIFVLSWQGSLVLVLTNSNHYISEGNPIMRTILDHNEFGAIFLFLIIAAGLFLSNINKKWILYLLGIGALILLINFIREILLFM